MPSNQTLTRAATAAKAGASAAKDIAATPGHVDIPTPTWRRIQRGTTTRETTVNLRKNSSISNHDRDRNHDRASGIISFQAPGTEAQAFDELRMAHDRNARLAVSGQHDDKRDHIEDNEDDDDDEDLSDEAFIRRHEPFALEERQRWAGMTTEAVATPHDSLGHASFGDVTVPCVATPRTPRATASNTTTLISPNVASDQDHCNPQSNGNEDSFIGSSAKMSSNIHKHITSSNIANHSSANTGSRLKGSVSSAPSTPAASGLRRQRTGTSRAPCTPLFPTPLECWLAVQRAVQNHRGEAGLAFDNRKAIRRRRRALAAIELPLHTFAALETAITREKLKLRRAIGKRRAVHGHSLAASKTNKQTVKQRSDKLKQDVTLSPVETHANVHDIQAKPDLAPIIAQNMAPDHTIAMSASELDLMRKDDSPDSQPINFCPRSSACSHTEHAQIMDPHMDSLANQSLLTTDGRTFSNAWVPKTPDDLGTSNTRVSKSTLVYELAAAQMEEIDTSFRTLSKRLLTQLRSLASQASLTLSKPANFANLQKDFTLMRRNEEAQSSQNKRDKKDAIDVYIQRSIDSTAYPSLAKSFSLRVGYRLDGSMHGPEDTSAEDPEAEVDNSPGLTLPHGRGSTPSTRAPSLLANRVQQISGSSSVDLSEEVVSLEDFDLEFDPVSMKLDACRTTPEAPIQPQSFLGPSEAVVGVVRNTGQPPTVEDVFATAPQVRAIDSGSPHAALCLPSMETILPRPGPSSSTTNHRSLPDTCHEGRMLPSLVNIPQNWWSTATPPACYPGSVYYQQQATPPAKQELEIRLGSDEQLELSQDNENAPR